MIVPTYLTVLQMYLLTLIYLFIIPHLWPVICIKAIHSQDPHC